MNFFESDKRPKRFGWAPGSYMNRCHGKGCAHKPETDRIFIGDKRAVICADCAYAELDVEPAPSVPFSETKDLLDRATADVLRKVMADAVERLGAWLTDNTEYVFEEEPEIDGIRSMLHEALEGKTP